MHVRMSASQTALAQSASEPHPLPLPLSAPGAASTATGTEHSWSLPHTRPIVHSRSESETPMLSQSLSDVQHTPGAGRVQPAIAATTAPHSHIALMGPYCRPWPAP